MINKTQWKPDTCECSLEYEWDNDLPVESRVHTISQVFVRCPAHVAIIDDAQHYGVVLEENTRKNIFLGEIFGKMPSVVEDVQREDGSSIKQLKSGLEYKWSFDDNRMLVVELVGFSVAEKNTAQGLADSSFGGGKVSVV